MYSVLNNLSEHVYFYLSKNLLLVFKIVERLQCILNVNVQKEAILEYPFFIVYINKTSENFRRFHNLVLVIEALVAI